MITMAFTHDRRPEACRKSNKKFPSRKVCDKCRLECLQCGEEYCASEDYVSDYYCETCTGDIIRG
jgi:hypothetical protein